MQNDLIAIDLGTKESLATVISKTKEPKALPNSDGERTTPSVVKFEKGGNTVVGKPAKRSAIAEPDRVVQEVKRDMGTNWRFKHGGSKYSPEEISSEIVLKVKNDAEQRTGETYKAGLISVPAYFGEPERRATKTAGELAGFDNVKLIEEPVAAFFSLFLEGKQGDGYYMIFDLGGGTFDTSVLKVDGNDIDVVAIEGVRKLGGQDFNLRIVDWLEDEFDEFTDPKLEQEVYNRVEEAKKELSSANETTISFPFQGNIESKVLTREKFEELIGGLIDRTLEESKKAIKNAGLGWNDLEDLMLVGGSTRIPLVQEKVEDIFVKEPKVSSKPDLAVAIGAIVKAAIEREGDVYDEEGIRLPSFSVNPMLAHSIGVEAVDEDSERKIHSKIIEKGEELPAEGEKLFTTEKDHQTDVKVKILEGESSKAKNCNVLGKKGGYKIDGIPPMKQGDPKIVLNMEMSEEGILKIYAEEKNSGENLDVKIERDELIEGEEKEKAKKRVKSSA